MIWPLGVPSRHGSPESLWTVNQTTVSPLVFDLLINCKLPLSSVLKSAIAERIIPKSTRGYKKQAKNNNKISVSGSPTLSVFCQDLQFEVRPRSLWWTEWRDGLNTSEQTSRLITVCGMTVHAIHLHTEHMRRRCVSRSSQERERGALW